MTNGDQTDTIFEALSSGETFETGLRTRNHEPDAPNDAPPPTRFSTRRARARARTRRSATAR